MIGFWDSVYVFIIFRRELCRHQRLCAVIQLPGGREVREVELCGTLRGEIETGENILSFTI